MKQTLLLISLSMIESFVDLLHVAGWWILVGLGGLAVCVVATVATKGRAKVWRKYGDRP